MLSRLGLARARSQMFPPGGDSIRAATAWSGSVKPKFNSWKLCNSQSFPTKCIIWEGCYESRSRMYASCLLRMGTSHDVHVLRNSNGFHRRRRGGRQRDVDQPGDGSGCIEEHRLRRELRV